MLKASNGDDAPLNEASSPSIELSTRFQAQADTMTAVKVSTNYKYTGPAQASTGLTKPTAGSPQSLLLVTDEVETTRVSETTVQDSVVRAATPLNPSVPTTKPESTKDASELDSQALHMAIRLTGSATGTNNREVDGTSDDGLSVDLIHNDEEVDLEEELVANERYVPSWETYTIQAGDTFADMAERALGLGYSEVIQLLEEIPDERTFTRWRVGDSFDFKINETGELLALRIMEDTRSGLLIERGHDSKSFEVTRFEKTAQKTERLFAGTVNGSFAQSASATGLSYSEVSELSNLLSKKINFRRAARRGDQFQVLVETDVIEGQAADSRILAAHYKGNKIDLAVVRNPTDDNFYTPEGYSLSPAFNRKPFKGNYRISSPFNLQRKHPITGRVSPHRGTDFAVITGTSIQSPANGRVVKSAYQANGAGNYVVIRHDNGYKTRYMHLSKRLVSEGERVSIGQKIALSGNTGRSTGPHLHYELMVNNNQVDAMRVKLPEGKQLSGQALAAFQKEAKQFLAQIDHDTTLSMIASQSKLP
ncbi:peptidoglycan DD-metalloendopeptidase family protein [Salinicola peritrichatus]|uniref:peptidoglycan DD-metalloendopeptidase family protein n=1 Tax=Salinicola peritrichatus TaxID=1267424 RepID=UPI001EF75A49|nr:peptidoglycan DD-metalloendopeptidase family protein [Salinicola peritrichatus]